MTEQLIGQLGYIGIALLLTIGGFGIPPIPEEAPVLLAAILTRNGKLYGPLAFTACMIGILLGDFVVYFVGYRFGERVLSIPLTRRLLTRPREAQIKGYFQRHGFKILILGRFAVGFRTAAYLTAGILRLPPLKLLFIDLLAALLSTGLMFTLGYMFAHQIQKGLHEAQQWVAVAAAAGVAGWLLYRHYRAHQRAGLPVGPPVLVGDDLPLPPDDLQADATAEPRPAARPAEPIARSQEPAPAAHAPATFPDAPTPQPGAIEAARGGGPTPLSRA